ncbi:NAD(P)H-binding protein [Levilactobacillus brevis]|uniref:NAD(P)H-binding protein n=1 Tax=Levilactobacillus brevis TaxID=1580 RepID=UPI0022DE55BC|nr:NAD(P)H-binding protein [Levilactobacillus brevis]MDA0411077.1 NAD(P)H-binding protein [Levilactobacillus brevis]
MKKVVILGANGQIARIVEHRILTEADLADVELTLFLRQADRLAKLADNPRVTVVEGDITDAQAVANVIAGMHLHQVTRVLATNVLGLYHEVGGEFGRWNAEMIGAGMVSARQADQLLAASDLDYTTLRLPWLNDRDEVAYTIMTHDQPYDGVSGSRQSVADVMIKLIGQPTLYQRESIGMANPATQGQSRPVY